MDANGQKAQPQGRALFITVAARTRDEIGELTSYLEQALRNLREVHEHARGGSLHMPSVLHDLRDVVAMTEAATVRVLDETEALVDEGRVVATLLEQMRADATPAGAESLAKVEAYVARSNDRAMAIIGALEFQDLTSQKVQRAFNVLEEVLERLGRIRTLVDLRDAQETPPAREEPPAEPVDPRTAQALADELLERLSE